MPLSGPRGGEGGASQSLSGFEGPVGGAPHGARSTAARYALLPLRLFLGITFVYAGFDKLFDSRFLSGSGPGSLAHLLDPVHSSASAPWLVSLVEQSPYGFGLALCIGEIAVGVGTLLGLWARVAAAGGALISLCLWLTVSWAATPYYYGNDLAYLMAWLPLVLAGAPYLSADAALHFRRRRRGRMIFS
ncbi:DoxX family protein [Streptomyces xiaopingdaonensis]|uniref:DoxX family protein n=1 Tax=Streptomyces xiaopingdaonensis TaxID=1565415 RepID=UPI000310C0C5